MCIPKPSNRLFCPQCGKFKLQFETERKALMYLEYNSDSKDLSGYITVQPVVLFTQQAILTLIR